MKLERESEEHLERLWHMKEAGQDALADFKLAMHDDFREEIVDVLSAEGLVELLEDGRKITLTEHGETSARRLIRAHRLAERLLYDVLGADLESGACEFEHIIASEVVDSICILLGHPRECPHGMPIPKGACCESSARTAVSPVVPLTALGIGQSARVAYVNCGTDRQLHQMDGLHIRPGAMVKLHQKYPVYVVECEGAYVALDPEITANICVWKVAEQA